MIYLIWCVCVLAAIYLYVRQQYRYFTKINVKQATPTPFFGSLTATVFRTKHMTEVLRQIYSQFQGQKFIGVYEFLSPVFVIRDLDLVKSIYVKDYDYFLDHRVLIDESIDPLFGRNLVCLKGQKWRDMRSTLSPAFTSSKLRNMFAFIAESGEQVMVGLKKEMDQNKVSYLDLEIKDLCTRYANDVIASCAFGLQVNSIENRDNYFYTKGKQASTFNGIQMLKYLGFTSIPGIMKFFKIKLINEEITKFFRDLVTTNMREREAKNILRPDMIHLLMEAKKGTLKHETKSGDADAGFATVDESIVGRTEHKTVWEDDDLIAQAMLFFMAGFDSAATVINFLAYELAINTDIQNKIQAEIDATARKNNGQINYNDVQNMTYLDMVVSETLRKWQPAVLMDRICVKPYNLGRPTDDGVDPDVVLQPGQGVWLPVHAIHHDEEYWPNPENFDPERFSEENKHKIVPFSYIPFGLGPRNCIGSRFALMEVKVLVYKLYSKFDILVGPKTSVPLKLDTSTFKLRAAGGCWLRFTERN